MSGSRSAGEMTTPTFSCPRPRQEQQHNNNDDFSRNLLVDDQPHVQDNNSVQSQQWYLGPSSTWSFSRRVLAHLEEYVSPNAGTFPSTPLYLDGAAYRFDPEERRHQTCDPALDIAAGTTQTAPWPAFDHALYLFHTVQFRLGQILHFTDSEQSFSNLYSTLQDDCAPTEGHAPFQRAYILLILAFGRALLCHAHGGQSSAAPKGSQYAAEACSLLPTIHSPDQDNVLAIRVFGLAALYLQSLDMRVTAFEFAGRALRLCYVTGIHRGAASNVADEATRSSIDKLWWSVYMLDQHLSALMGAPSAVQDNDVTAQLPCADASSPQDAALGVQSACKVDEK
ncbi:uncharacterized protein LTR77_003912 [Saxophila tyrrhenica]|uniref:Xylanolytic transcriptional activator regulatory domain-containing protein n=1 Tax=Saxophila tyrrhenica TaxID=1690608 RepID=A0AAV9PIH5_9PEZI|nr:hypothetical protein LTR77_003912 [Saxophila tyrrhenica]